MSKAFTKEDGPDAPPIARQRAPLPPNVVNHVTQRGLAALRDELAHLDARAASHPDDLAHAAWKSQLEGRLASAVVTPPPRDRGEVRFGAHVRVRKEDGSTLAVQIVGVDEADPVSGRIAFVSPLARALLGRRVGDVLTARTPGGEEDLELTAIEYTG